MSMMLETLNPAQKEAAQKIDRHVRIVAGAGSGKTRVLMARIEYLIKEIGIWPNRIMAITFTNKAANEMKQRLEAIMGEDAKAVRISTIHSLCARILRIEHEALGLGKNFPILDRDDQIRLLRPLYKEYEISKKDLSEAQVLGKISRWKMSGITPAQAASLAVYKDEEESAAFYEDYEKAKREMKALDFDDLLLECRNMLADNEEVRTRWQNRLDYIHVDEFQDVDPVQYDIVRHLCGPDTLLCVVGDPDQTIYTWRGAAVNIILKFDKDFHPCHTVILEQNYRSTPEILNASNALIAHNVSRLKKNLFTDNASDQPVYTIDTEDGDTEGEKVVKQLIKLHKEKKVPWEQIAILYRSNFYSLRFEKQLLAHHIPYRIFGGIRFFDRMEVKDLLSYLRLAAADRSSAEEMNASNLAFERMINQPRRGLGDVSLEKLRNLSLQKGISLLEAAGDPSSLSSAAVKKFRAFSQMVEGWHQALQTGTSAAVVCRRILKESGYEQMLYEKKEEERLENLEEFILDLERQVDLGNLSLQEYLADVSLYNTNNEEKVNGVSVMTVHAAKGLEFDAVFVTGLMDDLFPNARSVKESKLAGLEEERRLLYVAMTRARKYLTLTWNTGYSFVSKDYSMPSRFLSEIPSDLLHDLTRPQLYIQAEDKDKTSEKQPVPAKPVSKPVPKKPAVTLAAMSSKNKKGKKPSLRPGDQVEHSTYGMGVVISCDGAFALVTFKNKTGKFSIDYLTPLPKKNQTDSSQAASESV